MLERNAFSISFMKAIRITYSHPYLTDLQPWYEDSFPALERRSFDDLLTLLTCPDMHLCALVSAEQPVGFIIYWHWPDIDVVFIEHFAIDPARRGQQLGQQALATILEIKATYFFLETELPTDDIQQRRIRFYERQGFVVNEFAYAQPPYQRENPAIPMKLLSIPAIRQKEEFDRFRGEIQGRVYKRFYERITGSD